MTTNTSQTNYFKGYIYAVDGSGTISPDKIYWNAPDNKVLVGAPFHFYFGLRQGKSAFDKFAQIWIGDIDEL